MLPTHFVQQRSEVASADATQQDAEMHVYPPSDGPASSSLQTQLLGPRGITACTVQAQTPYSLPSESGSSNGVAGQHKDQTAAKRFKVSPPRWRTWEFRLYALVFVTIVPVMCWVPIRLSQETSRNFPLYASHLVPGWLFGRLRDDSDFQYKSFRDYVPGLTIVMVAYLLLSRLTERLGSATGSYQSLNHARHRPHRVAFLTIFTLIFLIALHGVNAIKLLSICAVNYMLAANLGGTVLATPAFWAYNVGMLFAVHYFEGFPLSHISPHLAWLEKYNGLLPRWQINFNITMLRLVSFALDFHWARKEAGDRTSGTSADAQREFGTSLQLDARKRGEQALPLQFYSPHNFFLYALYPPLFIAGPIMTFNDFCKQLYNPLPISQRYTTLYGIRWIFSLLSMEFILHFMYVNAIKDAKAWRGTSPMELSMIGFWNLAVVWLKLLIPWRFFRLWALADGMDAPENMIRCMANNYSTLGFWRSWHRSYNLWIVRYIYIPVGGAKNVIPATLLVFTFVALWHDLSLKLLTWGWLVTLFILPEIAARRVLPQSEYGDRPWYRHVAAAGGVVNVLMMMSANLVGFAIGTEGMAYMWDQLLSSRDGITFMVSACATLFVGVQVMFEYREEELRRGIDRKC